MLNHCRSSLLILALHSLAFASWLAVAAAAHLTDDAATCKAGQTHSTSQNSSDVASFHKHPALVSVLDLPHRQPVGR